MTLKQIILLVLLIVISLLSCNTARMAVEDLAGSSREELAVKGRQGFMVRQKLSFGEFSTGMVDRSWAKGSSWALGIGIPNDWVESLNVEFVRRRQTIRFNLRDEGGSLSEVTAFKNVRWRDFSVGDDPNSVVNIIGDMLQVLDKGSDVYAVRIMTGPEEQPWEMIIDNNAAQRNARRYTGLLARSHQVYYTVTPVYKMLNNKGDAVALPLGGSIGFSFRNPNGQTVAAVSLLDKGMVYFSPLRPGEKFLLANAAAALLLQEEI
jgi:predicted small secreted protein